MHTRYVQEIAGMVEKYGGRYIVASRNPTSVEGEPGKGNLIVIEFPTRQNLMEWYDSTEYRPLRDLRSKGARTNALIADGA
jgi:uncharacterized protein (DUF1330 family)